MAIRALSRPIMRISPCRKAKLWTFKLPSNRATNDTPASTCLADTTIEGLGAALCTFCSPCASRSLSGCSPSGRLITDMMFSNCKAGLGKRRKVTRPCAVISIFISRLICAVIWSRRASISTVKGTRNAAAITSVIGTRTVSNRMRIAKISMKPETRTIITYYVLPAAETPRNT